MAGPRFFFNRQGSRSGPHTVAEMEAFVREGLVRPEGWVLREGDAKWSPVRGHPELAAALQAQDPASAPEAAAPADGTAAPPAARTQLTRRASYAPGRPGAGFFLKIDRPATLLEAAIEEQVGRQARDLAARRAARRRLRWTLSAALAAAFSLDLLAADGVWVFTWAVLPAAVIAFLAGLVLTHPDPAQVHARMRLFGSRHAVALVLGTVIGLVSGMISLALTDGDCVTALILVAAGVLLVYGIAVREAFRLPAGEGGPDQEARLHTALRALRLLEDELPPRGALSGWIDLTGPEAGNNKIFASGTTPGGAEVAVYRDEWFQASGVLADGARLRVAAVEKRRVKRDTWKTGRSGKRKLKPGSTDVSHLLELRLRPKGGGTLSASVPCPGRAFTMKELVAGLATLRKGLREARAGGARP